MSELNDILTRSRADFDVGDTNGDGVNDTPLTERSSNALIDRLRAHPADSNELIEPIDPLKPEPYQSPMAQKTALTNQLAINLAKKKASTPSSMPSNIAEWQAYQDMTDAEKKEYLTMKRTNPAINLGGLFGNRDAVTGAITPAPGGTVTLKPGETVDHRSSVAGGEEQARSDVKEVMNPIIAQKTKGAEALGSEIGSVSNTVAEMNARLPHLEEVVNKLTGLGKTATYTWADQMNDTWNRQMKNPASVGAKDRAKLVSTVDNEVLPLLRQTFGAAFTKAEGDSLKAALVNPDSSPEEKQYQLQAFIEAQRGKVKVEAERLRNLQGGGVGELEDVY